MHDELIVDLKSLTKLSVICPQENCRAEVCFDLTQELRAREMNCPVCGNVLLGLHHQERLGFTWASLIKHALKPDGKPAMFFRVKRNRAEG